MSERRTDVLVVGGGVAGCAAALAARDAGAEVVVLESGAGATALSSGAWDVASEPAASLVETFSPRRTVRERIERIARERTHHPYARIGDDPAGRVLEAHTRVLRAIGGYDELDPDGYGALVATELGLVRRTAVAQDRLLDLGAQPGTVGVVGITGGYDARFVAASLGELAAHGGAERAFEPLELELEAPWDTADPHPHELARIGDEPALCEAFAEALSSALSERAVGAVLVPPVLGMQDGPEARSAIERAAGVPVGEVATSLAGPQGLRLSARIRRALEEAGCALEHAPVARVVPSTTKGTRVETESGETLAAAAVVLATGKHVGGGLCARDDYLAEPLAGLPVWLDGRLAPLPSSPQGPDPEVWLGRDWWEGGPGWRQGAGYDASLRALGADGEPVAGDLFVAGALLDGYEPSRDGTGLGCCATTGWIAGRSAAGASGAGGATGAAGAAT